MPLGPTDDARIGFLLTGGTIGSVRSAAGVVLTGGVGDLASLLATLAGASSGAFPYRSLMNRSSEGMTPRDWQAIAKCVVSFVEEEQLRGLVVLHGTDTATYTSAALSFLLIDCNIPVIITGSLLSAQDPASDAIANLKDAVTAASSMPPGVYLSFQGQVHLGTNARKIQGGARHYRFASINRQPVGYVVGGKLSIMGDLPDRTLPSATGPLVRRVDGRVLLLRLFPGLDFGLILPTLKRLRGIVVELYASATASNQAGPFSMPQFVAACQDSGVIVVGALAGAEGEAPAASEGLYASTLALRSSGTLIIDDMLPETAVAKLMWALAQSQDSDAIARLMIASIAGETRAPSKDGGS